MRIWLKDSERRPDPAPVKTDDRKAVLVGLALWLAAAATVFGFIGPLTEQGNAWWLWACIAGLGLGLLLLLYTQWKRRQDRRVRKAAKGK